MTILKTLVEISKTIFERLGLPPLSNAPLELAVYRVLPGIKPSDYGYLPYLIILITATLSLPLAFLLLGLPGLGISMLIAMISGALTIVYPHAKASSDASTIDRHLASNVGFLAILSATGKNIVAALETIYRVERVEPIKKLILRGLYYSKVLGRDIISTLNYMAFISPSHRLARILEGLSSSIRTLGDPTRFLVGEFERLIEEKAAKVEKALTNLIYVLESFVIMIVIGPVIVVLISVLGGAMGISLGLPAEDILVLTLVLFVPISILIMLIISDSIAGEVEAI